MHSLRARRPSTLRALRSATLLLFLVITARTTLADPRELAEALRAIAIKAGCVAPRVDMVRHPGQPLEIRVTCGE